VTTVNISGVPKEIRFYGDAAVVTLAWDPREIGFQGGTQKVTSDDSETVLCSLNDIYNEYYPWKYTQVSNYHIHCYLLMELSPS
jgi:hypothetical protein